MPRAGEELNRIVELLEILINRNEHVTIEANKNVPDLLTGKPREHDVLVTYHHPYRDVRIAVECKDRARPVDVTIIESFDRKCRDSGINQGIIVSSRGFTSAALLKASILSIRCLTLAQVEHMNRIFTQGFTANMYFFKNYSFFFDLSEDYRHLADGGMNTSEYSLRLHDGDVTEVTDLASIDDCFRFANQLWSDNMRSLMFDENGVTEVGNLDSGDVNISITNPEDFELVHKDGGVYPLEGITLHFEFYREQETHPFKFMDYRDDQGGRLFEVAATDEFALGDKTVRCVMMLDGNDLSMHIVERTGKHRPVPIKIYE